MAYLYVGIGGVFGALLRFILGKYISGKVTSFPLGTLVINVTGAFVLSFLFFFFQGGNSLNEPIYLALTTGALGAYTTFSTFTLETLNLLEEGRLLAAGAYLGGNVCLGLAGVVLGKAAALII